MRTKMVRASWWDGEFAGPWVFVLLAAVSVMFAIGAVFEALTSNALVGGPEYVTGGSSGRTESI